MKKGFDIATATKAEVEAWLEMWIEKSDRYWAFIERMRKNGAFKSVDVERLLADNVIAPKQANRMLAVALKSELDADLAWLETKSEPTVEGERRSLAALRRDLTNKTRAGNMARLYSRIVGSQVREQYPLPIHVQVNKERQNLASDATRMGVKEEKPRGYDPTDAFNGRVVNYGYY